MVEKTITIAIDANVQKFKKAMADAKNSVKATGTAVKKDTAKMSESVENVTKGSRFKAFSDAVKGLSPTFDGIAGSISDMGDRFKTVGKNGKLAMMGLKMAVGGLAVGIGVMLAKAIMDVTGKFAQMTDPARFDKANSEMKESIRTLKTSIGQLASPVFEYMAKGVSALAKGLTWVVEKLSMFVGFLQGLLGLGYKVNQTLGGTADAMTEAGASADAGLASFDKLNTLNTGEMGDMEQVTKMADLMDQARKAGEESAKSIRETFQPIYDLLNMDLGEVWEKFKQSAVDAWNGIKEWASNVWSGITGSIQNTWNRMTTWASQAGENIKTSLINAFHAVGEGIRNIFSGVLNAFKKAWNAIFGGIKSAIDWILDKIRWITDKLDGLRNAVKSVGDKVGGFVHGVADKVGGFFGGVKDKVKGAFGFAKGGLFQPNSPQLAIIGDNKTEPEVVAPRSMIMDAMRQVISENGGGNDRPIYLQVDGRTFARYVYDDFEAEGRRRGMRSIA